MVTETQQITKTVMTVYGRTYTHVSVCVWVSVKESDVAEGPNRTQTVYHPRVCWKHSTCPSDQVLYTY